MVLAACTAALAGTQTPPINNSTVGELEEDDALAVCWGTVGASKEADLLAVCMGTVRGSEEADFIATFLLHGGTAADAQAPLQIGVGGDAGGSPVVANPGGKSGGPVVASPGGGKCGGPVLARSLVHI